MRQDFLPFSLPTIGKEEITEAADSLKSGWVTTDCASIYSFSPCKYASASAPASPSSRNASWCTPEPAISISDRPAFVRTAWRAYTWAPDERIKRLILGLGAGMLAHQIFGLTDAFLLGTKPGVVMWMIMGLVTGLYLNLAPDHLGVTRRQGEGETI